MSRLEWNNVSVRISPGRSRTGKIILENISGNVERGEMLAIMGPSGCGKSTLLNYLANRSRPAYSNVQGEIRLNGHRCTAADVQRKSRFVESNDVLIGSLTVRETVQFTADLSLPSSWCDAARQARVEDLLQAFGLSKQADNIVGTLVRSGISTGQKRRLSVASMLVAAPQILFLDEPTSGLDSTASQSVMSYIKNVARANNLLVVCSIHQPSPSTFEQFDKLLLLSEGRTCYFGETAAAVSYFKCIGFPPPLYMNPADFILDLVNVDFEQESESITLSKIQDVWMALAPASAASSFESINRFSYVDVEKGLEKSFDAKSQADDSIAATSHSTISTTITLLHRSFLKSYRDVLVYEIRFLMYLGLAMLIGTVWLRLPPNQTSIQPYIYCMLFGSTFMSFMAVVYVPAFVEDRLMYVKDRANGLYGSTAFFVSNFLIGLPYLFAIAVTSSGFIYWMVNFRPDPVGFLIWTMWMFLNLVAAESLVVLVSSLIPNFIGALAATAFANGIFMACDGFMVAERNLNVFYRYVFYYINYQGYVLRGLVVNEFAGRNYDCDGGCYCQIDSPLREQCQIQGTAVLTQFGYSDAGTGKYIGIMLAIIVALRLFGWAAMEFRR